MNPEKAETSLFNEPYRLSIGGRLVRSDRTFGVINPATSKIFAQAPAATRAELDDAVAAAGAAFPAWAALGEEKRQAYLNVFADELEKHRDEFVRLLTLEQGKPLSTTATDEVNISIRWIREIAARRVPVEVVEETNEHIAELHHVPIGVVGAITPWNFPFQMAVIKIAPALITGNTIVLKPSPLTPLCTLRMGEIAQAVFPAGVVNVLSSAADENDIAPHLTTHPGVAKITFTGSTEVGKKVMQASAETVKRVTLELGGNDATIILPGTEWRAIVPKLFWAAFTNAGQWCAGLKRLYVHSSIKDEFVAVFVDYAKQQKVGSGLQPDVVIGPVQNRMQFEKVRSLLDDIKANGQTIALGGEIGSGDDGYFVPVTVVDNPPNAARIVQEEQFSPILPIIAYDEVEQAIAWANDNPYGLGGSVWGPDAGTAKAVAMRLETGTVWVNEIHTSTIDMPFGGHKMSGLGVEHGLEGRKLFTNPKIISIRK